MTSPAESRADANRELGQQVKVAVADTLSAAGTALGLVTDPAATLKEMGEALRKSVVSSNYDERKEAAATALVIQAASSHEKFRTGQQVNKRSLEQLVQELTLKALEAKVEDRVRAIVAAAIGPTEKTDMATPDDLFAAETILNLKDHQVAFFRELLPKWIGPNKLDRIHSCPRNSWNYAYPFRLVCDGPNHESIALSCRGYFPNPWDSEQNLYVTFHHFGLSQDERICRPEEHSKHHPFQTGVVWPSELLQRIHNALIRARENIEFELKL